jgi:hypothetical protein
MAVALTLLIALPVLAADGQLVTTNNGDTMTIGVYDNAELLNTAGLTAVTATSAEDTKVGNVFWVSNDPGAFNRVYVKVLDADPTTATITVDVTNVTTGSKLVAGAASTSVDQKLILSLSSTSNTYHGNFEIRTDGTNGVDNVTAAHLNTVRITYTNGDTTIVTDLKIDGNGPIVSGLSPANGVIQSSTSATFAGIITDADSGMRSDGEKDEEPSGNNDGDADGVTSTEPIAASGGKSTDIDINLGISSVNATPGSGDNESAQATSAWSAVTNGFAFAFTRPNLDTIASGSDLYWQVTARDRVGNSTATDVDSTDTAKDHFKIVIDNQDPTIRSVKTGIGYDQTGEKETVARNGIKVVFENETSSADDDLDATTVAPADFLVPGYTVTGALVVDHIVYLTLSANLVSSAKPNVQILAGVLKDAAGNANGTEDVQASDGIAPSFTVTVTGTTTSGRPAISTDAADKLKVRVVSDEVLQGGSAPTIFFAKMKVATDSADGMLVDSAVNATPGAVSGATLTWEKSFSATELGIGGGGIVAIVVVGSDEGSNKGGTTGWKDGSGPDSSLDNQVEIKEELDIVKLHNAGLLAEVDDSTVAGTPSLQPGSSSTTESANPFIRVDFTESGENTLGQYGSTSTFTSITIDDVKVNFDGHSTITLTSITLDAVDVSGQTARIDSDSFSIAAKGLALGDHTLEAVGVDDVGNKVTRVFEFEVVERSAYKVSLSPGWNLVSLPANPSNAAIDSVLPGTMNANTVLAYHHGEWRTATRASGGDWEGTLTEITSGNGYWVQTGSFEDISTLIPERDPAGALPTIPVIAGWNLIGVTDLAQRAAGATTAVDTYMSSISQKVVYTYNTQASAWSKVVSGGNVENGKGYWVWADKAGTLVP